jgi:DNA-binding XRE family transcriptional regulator
MRELRSMTGATQQECADALGITQASYQQMEVNEIRFRRRDLVTLAALYKLDLEDAFPEPSRVG